MWCGGATLSLGDKPCAANGRAGEVELPKPSGAQKIMSEFQRSDVELDFGFLKCVWFFLFEIRKYLTHFLFYSIPQLKKFWTFKKF